MAPSRQWRGAFGTQLNFIRTGPSQTKDKIRLLTQKLEEGFVPPNAVSKSEWSNCAQGSECFMQVIIYNMTK